MSTVLCTVPTTFYRHVLRKFKTAHRSRCAPLRVLYGSQYRHQQAKTGSLSLLLCIPREQTFQETNVPCNFRSLDFSLTETESVGNEKPVILILWRSVAWPLVTDVTVERSVIKTVRHNVLTRFPETVQQQYSRRFLLQFQLSRHILRENKPTLTTFSKIPIYRSPSHIIDNS